MQIFQKIKKETQEFFLKTAFLPTVTVRVAEKLSGFSASEQILSDLGENHYFTESHPQSPPVYQYHPLFREFLFSRARDSYSTDEISRIQQSAALLLEESGQEYDAVSLLGKAKDWGNLIRIILSRAHALMVQGRETEKSGETENTRRGNGEARRDGKYETGNRGNGETAIPERTTSEEEIMQLAEKAIGLYKGHFLPGDEEETWTVSYLDCIGISFFILPPHPRPLPRLRGRGEG